MAKLVSKVYGDALFETAMEKSLWISLRGNLCSAPHFTANPELFSVLGKPADRKRREGCLITSVLFSGKDCGGADGLLSIIVEKDRQNRDDLDSGIFSSRG